MSGVFADSFYFLALINVYDAHHEAARSLANVFRRPMITTEFVLLEVADALAAERWREGLSSFVENLRRAPTVEVIPLSSELFNRGLSLYAARQDKE